MCESVSVESKMREMDVVLASILDTGLGLVITSFSY